MMNANHKI